MQRENEEKNKKKIKRKKSRTHNRRGERYEKRVCFVCCIVHKERESVIWYGFCNIDNIVFVSEMKCLCVCVCLRECFSFFSSFLFSIQVKYFPFIVLRALQCAILAPLYYLRGFFVFFSPLHRSYCHCRFIIVVIVWPIVGVRLIVRVIFFFSVNETKIKIKEGGTFTYTIHTHWKSTGNGINTGK